MNQTPTIGFRKYIGRDYESYNCFDLVRDFYAEFFGLDLKHYFEGGPVPKPEAVASLIVSNKGDFIQADKPAFGDIVVIRLYGIECHIGVCVNDLQFLHSSKTTGSTLDRLERYKKLIAGFYRHRELE